MTPGVHAGVRRLRVGTGAAACPGEGCRDMHTRVD
jgi:hypothetical protein